MFLVLSAIAAPYDSSPVVDPLRDPHFDSPAICGEFYQVNRPVAPLVGHSFVGLRTFEGQPHQDRLNPSHSRLWVFGATKGHEDRQFFEAAMRGSKKGIKSIGFACGENLRRAVAQALLISRDWEELYFADKFRLCARFMSTPLAGKACRSVVCSIQMNIEEFLFSE